MSSKLFLSVVIPAYNEQANLQAGVLEKVHQYLKRQSYSSEVIVVDDGSTDQTLKLLKPWGKKSSWQVIANPHQGKAATVKTGILAAQGQLVLFTDFDQATPLSEIEKLLPFIKKNYDIVIGSREVKGSQREGEPWYRHLMGKVFNFSVQLLTIRGIRDTQCGFKLFTRSIAQKLFQQLVVYSNGQEKQAFTGAFDVELLFLAQKHGYKIAEVPVHWRHVHTERINPINDSIRMFCDLLRMRLADLTGKYK